MLFFADNVAILGLNDRLKDWSFWTQFNDCGAEVSTKMAFAATTNKPMRNLNKARQESEMDVWTHMDSRPICKIKFLIVYR